jgi:hypothetical protein
MQKAWIPGWRILPAAILTVAVGCGDRGPGPAEQYESVLEALRKGSLLDAYVRLMPAGYDRDLNELLERAKRLVSEEDFEVLRDFVAGAGGTFAEVLASSDDGPPPVQVLCDRLESLPSLLGMDDYRQFRSLDVREILKRLDGGLFGAVAKLEGVRERLASTAVKELDRKREWAQLRFTANSVEAGETEERVQVVLVEEKWVPVGWEAQWEEQIKRLHIQLDAIEARLAEDPAALREKLRSFEPERLREAALAVRSLLGLAGGSSSGAETE